MYFDPKTNVCTAYFTANECYPFRHMSMFLNHNPFVNKSKKNNSDELGNMTYR